MHIAYLSLGRRSRSPRTRKLAPSRDDSRTRRASPRPSRAAPPPPTPSETPPLKPRVVCERTVYVSLLRNSRKTLNERV